MKEQNESSGSSSPLSRKLASVVSGSASGAVVSLTLQPLDVIRTQLQAQAGSESRVITKSVLGTAKDIFSNGGVKNFWRGSDPTFWRLSIGLGIQFLTLETITDAFIRRKHVRIQSQSVSDKGTELSRLEAFLSGGFARGVAAAATVPFTIAKTRMEHQGPNAYAYKNTFAALKSIGGTEGAKGLFRGMGPTILTNAPFSALYYMFYSDFKKRLQPEGQTSSIQNFTAGTFAAVAATVVTQPTDVIRTHMQLGNPANARLGILAIVRAIVNNKGPKALLAGAAPRILKRTLQTALVWTIYEELKPFLLQQYGKLQTHREDT